MTWSRNDRETAETFRERYGRPATDATRELERAVIGGDFGANGYTTRAQADLLGVRLRLTKADRLLDVGTGRGWPGLYLAATSGCSVVLADIPEEGLLNARERAAAQGLGDQSVEVVASARRLPFQEQSFDAIVHTDVTC